jgi:hypothetical protein
MRVLANSCLGSEQRKRPALVGHIGRWSLAQRIASFFIEMGYIYKKMSLPAQRLPTKRTSLQGYLTFGCWTAEPEFDNLAQLAAEFVKHLLP